MRRAAISHAVFGVADGLTSLVGVLAGLLVAHAASSTILTTVGGLAVAGGVGMASGDYLAGAGRIETAAMGAATTVGSLLPALPVVLLTGPAGWITSALITLGIAVAVAETRYASSDPDEPVTRLRAYTTTAVILTVASGLAAGAALLLGAAG